MIDYIRGILVYKGESYIVVDVNGIGYRVFVPANSEFYLEKEEAVVKVHTIMIVREDDVSLYGFNNVSGLEIFRMLLSVNGVGAKAAMAILSSASVQNIIEAVIYDDISVLTKASGVGKKTAQRIILELKDKIEQIKEKYMLTEGKKGGEIAVHKVEDNARKEAEEALTELGFTRAEASERLAMVEDDNLTAEEYIRRALTVKI